MAVKYTFHDVYIDYDNMEKEEFDELAAKNDIGAFHEAIADVTAMWFAHDMLVSAEWIDDEEKEEKKGY